MCEPKYKHSSVCLIARNNVEYLTFQRILLNNGLTWLSGASMILFRTTISCSFHIYLNSMDFGIGYIDETSNYIERNTDPHNPTIFNVDNLTKLIKIIKYGKIYPSYKPRTIKK